MPNKDEWYETIQPLHLKENNVDIQRISQRVQEQLLQAAERESNMETRKAKHTLRNILFAVTAVFCMGTATAMTANAVTDGALFQKFTVRINGEDVDFDVIQEGTDEDGNVTYDVVDEESDWNIQISDDGEAAVEYHGTEDVDEVEIEVEVDEDTQASSN
ncbi:MAG: hypothetical protein LUF89_06335 [Ruminococcus sp.]|nr:hypothetical protein [Ruminococcus sp.]